MAREDVDRAALRDARWRMVLRLETNISVGIGLLMLIVWALAGAKQYWFAWVWFALAIPLGFQVSLRRGLRAPRGHRLLPVQGAISGFLAVMFLVIWLLAGKYGNFWPVWPILSLSVLLVVHAWIKHALPSAREQALADRVEVLTRTRRGALDVQAAELQRIERDLHDGAQARLVAMGMNLGAAEALLDNHPEAARALLVEAREASAKALTELRELVRGIHPPVLADRGLGDAVRALGLDSPLPVEVTVDIPGRLEPAVESAAYFAISELLTNVSKHARAHSVRIDLWHRDRRLRVTCTDDGRGGAMVTGADDAVANASRTGGSGLAGIERRIGTFDGVMAVHSPVGGPTTVTLEIPCVSSSAKTSTS